MSDIFREIEEDVRRDRMEKLWQAYGAYVVGLVVVILLAVAGYELWQRYETGQRQKDSLAFSAASRIQDPNAAAKAFADLSKTAGGGYAVLAQMEEANFLNLAGKHDAAVALYRNIAAADAGPVGAAARIRGSWLLVDTAPRSDVETLLKPLLDPASPWKQLAQEILAYSDYRHSNMLMATNEFAQIANDPQAPDTLRNRAHAFAAYLSGGGAANFGTVPPPAPPALPAAEAPAGATAP